MKMENCNEIHPYFEERMHSSYENLKKKDQSSKPDESREFESIEHPVLLEEGIGKDDSVERI